MSRNKSSTTSKRLFTRCVLARFASLVSKEQGRVSGDSEKFSLPKKKNDEQCLIEYTFLYCQISNKHTHTVKQIQMIRVRMRSLSNCLTLEVVVNIHSGLSEVSKVSSLRQW